MVQVVKLIPVGGKPNPGNGLRYAGHDPGHVAATGLQAHRGLEIQRRSIEDHSNHPIRQKRSVEEA